jgi:hypothetical protein
MTFSQQALRGSTAIHSGKSAEGVWLLQQIGTFAVGLSSGLVAMHDWISCHTSAGQSSGTTGGGICPLALGTVPVTVSSSTTPKLHDERRLVSLGALEG